MLSDLWSRIAQTGGARLYGALLGVVTLSLTARWLGPEGRGELAAITAWVSLFVTVVCLSLGQVTLHKAAQKTRELWLSDAYRVLTFAVCILTLAGVLLALGLAAVSDGVVYGSIDPLWLALGMLLLPLTLWEQYSSAMLSGLERLDVYNRYQIAGRSIAVLIIILLVGVLDVGVAGVLGGNIAGAMVVAVGALVFLRARTSAGLPARPVIREYFGDGLKLHLNTLGAFLFNTGDILMLNYFRGGEETGYYRLGVQLLEVMLILPQTVAMVIYGRIAAAGSDGAWPDQRKLVLQGMGVMLGAVLVAGLTAQWWLPLLAGEAFTPSIDLFKWQLLTVVGMSFAIVMAPQWITRGFFWQMSALTFSLGVANLAANAFLIPAYGMYGAVWASIGVYVVSVAANLAMAVYCDRRSA